MKRSSHRKSSMFVRTSCWLLLTLAALFCASPAASAQDGLPLRQFDHQAWGLRDGAPSDILAMAQTRDGYLWLGTPNGLFRFDGVRFEEYVPQGNQHLIGRSVQALLATPDGGLWIGYTLGFTSFLKDGKLQNFNEPIKQRGGTVWSFALEGDGSVWAGTYLGPEHFVAGAWHGVYQDEGFDTDNTSHVFVDETGSVWLGTDQYLYRRPPASKQFHKTRLQPGGNVAFEIGPGGTLWISDDKGVLVIDEKAPESSTPKYVAKLPFIHDLHFDATGGLWITSFKTGLYRVQRPQAGVSGLPQTGLEHFTVPDGLPSQRIEASFKDREGSMWIASTDGLRRFRPTVLQPATLPSSFAYFALAAGPGGSIFVGTDTDGLQRYKDGKVSGVAGNKTEESVSCLYQAADGKLWFGGDEHLRYLEHGRLVEVPTPPEIRAHPVIQALTVDSAGDLWMQKVSLSPILRLHGKEWTPIPSLPTKAGAAVVLMADHKGRVWAGYMKGILAIYSGNETKELLPRDGVVVGNVTALYESGENVWVGGEHGLEVFLHDRPVRMNFDGPEQIAGISGILTLPDGSMWLNSLNGVLRIDRAELEHFLREPAYAVHFSLFNYLDGVAGKAPQLRPLPSLILSSDGRIWATTTNGAASLDPRTIPKNLVLPPVAISSIKGDGSVYTPSDSLSLPKRTQNVEIDYTALSMAIPERVQFKYKLEGFDHEWQDAGTRRQAFYTNLPPRTYTFHVIASNNDGLWNNVGATTSFYLAPAFYQTLWFKLALALLCVAVVLWLVALRLRYMAYQIRERWRVRLTERERIARELHDTFLQGIQGVLLRVRTATRNVDADSPARSDLEDALRQSNEVMVTGRSLVQDLRSVTRPHSLIFEFEAVGREFQGLYSTAFVTSVKGSVRDLNAQFEEELCKIGREAISNAFHHANASIITVELEYGLHDVKLIVRDDGVGISGEIIERGRPGHWGLPGIRERVKNIRGTLRVESEPGQGTTLEVRVLDRAAVRTSPFRLPQWIGISWREDVDV